MNIKKLVETQEILWQSMRETGYCREYIIGYSHKLRWIEANAEKFDVSSYMRNYAKFVFKARSRIRFLIPLQCMALSNDLRRMVSSPIGEGISLL